ncbi:MAG: isocitrate/isopropylmalate family dehydrogenase [Candidatus Helarchaeota archaeon]
MKTVTCIGGEGIGVEVVNATFDLLRFMTVPGLELIREKVGIAAEKEHGKGNYFPESVKETILDSDAVLFGATHEKTVEVLHYLRFELDNFAHLRPCKYYEGLPSPLTDPKGIDMLFVREGMESIYSALRIGEGNLKTLYDNQILDSRIIELPPKDWKEESYYALKIVSEYNSKRISEFAVQETIKRKKAGHLGRMTIIHKANVLPKTDGLFKKIAYEIASPHREQEGILINDFHVDDMARRIIKFPREQDVLLCMNEYGDILSDLAAEIVGGIGMAPSGCIGGKVPYFEPIHGAAPDIANPFNPIANPIACFLSAKMMLEHLNFYKEAVKLEIAVEEFCKLIENVSENWKFIPRDLVPEEFQAQQKYAKTRDVLFKIRRIYDEI